MSKKKTGLLKPKYKIGDLVMYIDRFDECGGLRDDGLVKVVQSRITEAWSLTTKGENDTDWYYHTEQTIRDEVDYLEEIKIISKL